MDGYRFAALAAFVPNWSLILTSVNIWALTGQSNALAIVLVTPHLFSPQNSFTVYAEFHKHCVFALYGKAW